VPQLAGGLVAARDAVLALATGADRPAAAAPAPRRLRVAG
jgi:hypothetical protein